jgi:plastocyanin
MVGRQTRALLAAVVLLAGGACGGGSGDSGGSATRRVMVDHSSDEFATFALFNFPAKVTVRQGDAVEFKQTWTGEPHTVTGGTSVTKALKDGVAWVDFFESFDALASSGADLPNPEDPGDATVGDFAKGFRGAENADVRDKGIKAYEELVATFGLPALDESSTVPFADLVEQVETKSDEYFSGLPSAFDDNDELAQNVGQPCFLDEGSPPEDTGTPCAKKEQVQPRFNGRQSSYNSGVIPYEGPRGNTFTVRIAPDAELGSYLFYCAIHGLGQKSEIEIVDADADIPSQSEVNRQIREETNEITKDLEGLYDDAKDDLEVTLPGADEPVKGPFAGLPGKEHTAINEFVPKELTVKAGEPITWKMMGSDHSISFRVPRYFPIMEFLKDGTVRINPKISPPAGGAIEYVEADDGESEGPPKHDGGSYDGTGFWSSGLIGGEPYLEYTMRITKPGTYNYACLLHPPMVGRIKVT